MMHWARRVAGPTRIQNCRVAWSSRRGRGIGHRGLVVVPLVGGERCWATQGWPERAPGLGAGAIDGQCVLMPYGFVRRHWPSSAVSAGPV